MKGKSKSKKKPTSGETRVRLTLKDKRDVIAMRKMGLPREKIEAKMGKLSDTLWFSTDKVKLKKFFKSNKN